MQIPPSAPVSVWKIIVHTARKGVPGVSQHQIESAVYVLFNPWCPSEFSTETRVAIYYYIFLLRRRSINLTYKTIDSIIFSDDGVYMNDEEQLDEYVLNDNGKVWQGTFKEPKGYQWFFGQFDAIVLPSVMMLLDRASIPHQERASPVKMARSISAIVSVHMVPYCNNILYWRSVYENNEHFIRK